MNFLIKNKNIIEHIKKHALSNPIEEVCGLIINKDNNFIALKCRNISQEKNKNFTIDCFDYLEASDNGKIVGCYHSHINDEKKLTNFDRLNAINHNINYISYNINHDIFDEFDPKIGSYELIDFIGKNFNIENQNCYTLIQKFYKDQFNINLPNFKINKNWYKEDPYIIQTQINRILNKILKQTELPKYGDIIIFKYIENYEPNHFGIYLNNKEFLHHPQDKNSTIELFNDFYTKRTFLFLTPYA